MLGAGGLSQSASIGKVKLAQCLKVFMDMADRYPEVKIIAIGAVDSAREVALEFRTIYSPDTIFTFVPTLTRNVKDTPPAAPSPPSEEDLFSRALDHLNENG
jgi:hypothetical protein